MSTGKEIGVYYEVVRVIRGKVLFLPDHLERLQHSLSGSGLPYPGDQQIKARLKQLISKSGKKEGNIRIDLLASKSNEPELIVGFVPHRYPDQQMYENGVKMILYTHLRPNPGIKKLDNEFRTSVQKAIEESGAYEAALVNPFGEITEGSRSNLFFIRDNEIISPPVKDILPGITRKYVLKICSKLGIEATESRVAVNQLESMSACFISGTSPKVLPVKRLDRHIFSADHPMIKMIMKEFDLIMNTHLTEL